MSKINRNKIEQFLQWEGGQRLFNFAYSIGAALMYIKYHLLKNEKALSYIQYHQHIIHQLQ